MAFKGYRVVVLTPLASGGDHRTPWSYWTTREDAIRIWEYKRRTEPGRWLAVESKRGVLSHVTSRYGWKVSA